MCKVEKIHWGNTDNNWKPVSYFDFDSFDDAREFIRKDKDYAFSHLHKYNISLNIENY